MSTTSPAIDRMSPTKRPDHPLCGWQEWRQLLFLHWEVSPDVLRPMVPSGLEIDTFHGATFVGLVPFQMLGVRPWTWWPNRMAFRFLETNVRVYVHYRGRPGVYFLSLEAASWLAVRAARVMWGLPYCHAKMKHEETAGTHHYCSARRGQPDAKSEVRFQVGAALPPASPDSLEFFLLERYLLFVERNQAIWEGQVHHTPYPAHHAESVEVADGLISAAGIEPPTSSPQHAHYSPGVQVEIFPLRRADG